jgi:hypothetical protein
VLNNESQVILPTQDFGVTPALKKSIEMWVIESINRRLHEPILLGAAREYSPRNSGTPSLFRSVELQSPNIFGPDGSLTKSAATTIAVTENSDQKIAIFTGPMRPRSH